MTNIQAFNSLIFTLLLSIGNSDAFVKPQDTVVERGVDVELKCSGESAKSVQWWITKLPGFSFPQLLSEGNKTKEDATDYMEISGFYNLRIKNISYIDGNLYYCKYQATDHQAYVTVLEKIDILQEDFNKTEMGKAACNITFGTLKKVI
ncbi:DgyrCDS8764 [Dimorphilus gyrociliatus]|uniref:DgyrCDS8764 n=1 Tax=Dimorphilus gyrociliatus TaxID=2664684 RepID=A0A7I8VV37_9ANNE|nr:DgyrCDS8764 [Dimorphilus gyrociliatus]